MKRLIVLTAATAVLIAPASAGAMSPGTQGQPNQSCEDQSAGPPGIFSKDNGFANTAVNVYAGVPGTPSATNGNGHAVSQYDVACFEVSSQP
jgi:hypothetical protein